MQCMMNYRRRKRRRGNEKRGVLTTAARPSNIVLNRKPAQSRLLTLKTVLCAFFYIL